MIDTSFIPVENPDLSSVDPATIGSDTNITTESISARAQPFSVDYDTGTISINKPVVLDFATIGNIDIISPLPNPNLGNQLVVPSLQVGGTVMANDIILGSNGITKFISDNTGTYIYNNLSVSGNINSIDLTNKLNSKVNSSDFSTLSSQVSNKADQTDLITNYYNKNQTNDLLLGKANSNNVYSIGQVDSQLNLKANSSDVYTKTQVDTSLSSKANSADVYTKTEVDTSLSAKANSADVYTKTQVDTSLGLKANLANPTFTGTVSGITKNMIGLANVDNTSDASKPVSTAQQTALDLKANLANPTFTGTATAPTINATTALQVAGANINTIYAPLANPTFTGTATAPTINASTALQVAGSDISNLYQARNPVQGQIQVSGTTPSISSTNGTSTITNVSRTSTGVYTITWSPSIISTTYGVIGILRNQAGYLTYNGTTGTSMNINTFNTSGAPVDAGFSFYIFR